MNKSDEVEQFLKTLKHPFKKEIELIREDILSSNKDITEHIKWNAPSFCYKGNDRVTFRLFPEKNIQLVFHRGGKVTDSNVFKLEDSMSLLQWITKDRAVVTLENMEDVKAKKTEVIKLVNEWMKLTS